MTTLKELQDEIVSLKRAIAEHEARELAEQQARANERKRKERLVEIQKQDAFAELKALVYAWQEKHKDILAIWQYPSEIRCIARVLAGSGSIDVMHRRRF